MLLVAHRTPASRARCAALAAAGARVFEVDVRLRGDELAVSHFVEVPFGHGRVQRDNWRFRWHSAGVGDPALAGVDDVVPHDCTVLLDVKESRPDRRLHLVERMATTLPRRDRYLVCSPYGDDLARARASGFRTWRTARDRRELAAALAGLRAEPDVSEAVSVRHTLLDERTIAAIRDVGAAAVAWTVNDLRRARHLVALGADGVTSDRVAVLRGLSALDPEGGGR